MPDVILVNESDQPRGYCEKLAAHQKGLLHRAFSVFIFSVKDNKVQLLLQQRQQDKYHCGGLWTNTCCSHPLPGEEIISAGERRLKEEMGFVAPLQDVGHFIYQAKLNNRLIEHELDHVLIGTYEGPINQFNRNEVMATQWCGLTALETQLKMHPEQFTPWFLKAYRIAKNNLPPPPS